MPILRRRSQAGSELPTDVLVSRVRAARARKSVARTDSEAWRAADAEERATIAELKRQFGVQNTSAEAIEWLLERRNSR